MMTVFMFRHPTDYFTDSIIKGFKKMDRGHVYIVIYYELYLLGYKSKIDNIFFDLVEDDFYSEIAMRIDEDREDVEFVVNYLVDRERVVITPKKIIRREDSEMLFREV